MIHYISSTSPESGALFYFLGTETFDPLITVVFSHDWSKFKLLFISQISIFSSFYTFCKFLCIIQLSKIIRPVLKLKVEIQN